MNSNFYKTHTHISSSHKWLDLKLNEVWQYRDLIFLFTKRTFSVSYKQTILGPLWLFISPFCSSIVYMILFGNIAKLSTEGVPQLLFYFSSNAIWGYFSACLTKNSSTFTGNAGLFGKVYFPRLVIPVSTILSTVIRFGIQISMAIVLLIYFVATGYVSPHWIAWLLIPFILLHLGILGTGFGIIISSMTTKYRDLSILVDFGVSLLMYATPVVYPLSAVNGILRKFLLLNPVSAPVELFRYAFLGKGSVSPWYLGYSWVCTLIVAFLGIIIFNKVERTFMDTV